MKTRALPILAGLAGLGSILGGHAGCGSSSCEDTRTCASAPHDGGGGQAGDAGGVGGVGGAGGQADAAQSFTLALDQASLSVMTGASASVNVTVQRTGNVGAITLELVGAANGVSATPVTLTASDTTAKLDISAAANAAQGPASVKVHASGGSEVHEATLALLVRGQPGTLDTSFGSAGIADLSWVLGQAPVGPVVAGDGSVFVAGSHSVFDDLPLEVVHVPESGTPDPSFGSAGKALFPAGGDGSARSANALVLDAQGRLVIAGTRSQYTPTPTGPFVSLVRLKADGTADGSFGTAGEVGGATGQAFRALVQTDGKTLVAGRISGSSDLFVHRVDASGSDDPSFGQSANVVVPLSGVYTVMAALLPAQAGGSLLVYGFGGANNVTTDVMITALDSSGSLASYGAGGTATLDAGGEDTPFAAIPLPGGGLVMGGSQGSDGFIMQVTSNGDADGSFGAAGVVKANGGFVIQGLAQDPQNRLVAVGPTSTGWRVARYVSDGTADASFGSAGEANLSQTLVPSGVALLPDGRIVVVLSEVTSGSYGVRLARLWP